MRYLVKRAQNDDEEAFIELIERSKQGMYKVAKSYLHCEEDVADAMQETILACYEKIRTLKEPDYFQTWMIRILINRCKDILKKNKELRLLDDYPERPFMEEMQVNLEFEELLESVGEKYKTILVLYYVEGFNTREIAGLLDMNEHTVKTRLARGRDKFRKEYMRSDEIIKECNLKKTGYSQASSS
ncbi:RNA polymerase sigma factor [Murimonas intestini]|uniref:RNA polymerase sigma-70 factor (ECF subfamily) n=1 Tax=Murimonas intestini TaxID=1337051 RepID=A0AB73T9K6_9FIRM|nr:sigma-70 family RNA polymerase sigma factor [Murimonas intestini]MCR1864542.1 sigma-70 family RNA polymerase sigma factor [Murimonas intestini]MCR1882152.1 sigma-70 family RNA polymerase sigma factor [Murimonas intestini]